MALWWPRLCALLCCWWQWWRGHWSPWWWRLLCPSCSPLLPEEVLVEGTPACTRWVCWDSVWQWNCGPGIGCKYDCHGAVASGSWGSVPVMPVSWCWHLHIFHQARVWVSVSMQWLSPRARDTVAAWASYPGMMVQQWLGPGGRGQYQHALGMGYQSSDWPQGQGAEW